MFKRTRHTVDFFSHFSICSKEPDVKNPQVVTTAMLLAAYDKHLTVRNVHTNVRLFTQQDAQSWAASHCFGCSMESSRARPLISRPAVSWSQKGCSNSRHHNHWKLASPDQNTQVLCRLSRFNSDKKPFPAASSTTPLLLLGQKNAHPETIHWQRAMQSPGVASQSQFFPLGCQYSPLTSISISTNDKTISHLFYLN